MVNFKNYDVRDWAKINYNTHIAQLVRLIPNLFFVLPKALFNVKASRQRLGFNIF